ncbi:MAG: prephenate dehydrogenase [Clostridiales bacterium]|nr:prephenate dehydrogenase [Clostridiales bacterium]
MGLGLIGGSLAYASRGFRQCRITGYDIDPVACRKALAAAAVDRIAPSAEAAVSGADLSVFCTSPETAIGNARRCSGHFKAGSVFIEICGVKQEIAPLLREALPAHVDYIGVHPMAGKEVGGFDNAAPGLFKGAGFILIPPGGACRPESLETVRAYCLHAGAGRICSNTARDHDRIIAYTSDLMHIAATALCAEYPADMTMAHAAGAFRDCTRVADIDAALWTELLLKNARNIAPFLETYIASLSAFKTALQGGDAAFVNEFLRKAGANKKEMQKL